MSLVSRKIHTSSFTLSGAGTTYQSLNPVDLSHTKELLVEIKLTTANTDAGDTLEVTLQDCSDATFAVLPTGSVGWNSRARSNTFLGTLSPSATTPEYYRMSVQQLVELSAIEESYEPTGSVGATEIAVGSVINGPFPATIRAASGLKEVTRIPNWRLRFVTAQTGTASFAGTVTIHAVSEV